MQLALLAGPPARAVAPQKIVRNGARLEIPEGIGTINFTHGLHRFPGKFIPQVPRYIFQHHLRPKSCVLDPFCGSATTILEAVLDGRECVGCDIDPLSILIARGKLQPLSIRQLLDVRRHLGGIKWRTASPALIPQVLTLGHWFSDQVIEELSALKRACLALDEPSRTFALVLFSSIIRRVSNADDQTQKTYVSHTNKKTPPTPQELFPVILGRNLDRMAAYSKAVAHSPRADLRIHDARRSFSDIAFNDVVTSPPYIDSIDYIYNQMLEYFWLLPELGLSSHEALKGQRKRPMGMARSKARLPKSVQDALPDLEAHCSAIEAKSQKEAEAIRTFFSEYNEHVAEIAKVQARGSVYASVIASSIIRGVVVPTPEALIAIHLSHGYELVDRYTYGIKRHYMKFPRRHNSSKIVEDNILIFRL